MDGFSLVIGAGWGAITFICWTLIIRRRWSNWRRFRDGRARRGLLFAAPLWLISVTWTTVLFLSVVRDVADVGSAVRGLLFGIGVGMYTFAGLFGAFGSRR